MISALVLGFVVCGWRLSVEIPDPDLDALSRAAFLDALAEAHISRKEACALMGFSKSHFSEIENGTKSMPSHTRLLKLPWVFWQHYLPKLAYTVTLKNVIEIANDARVRASIKRSA